MEKVLKHFYGFVELWSFVVTNVAWLIENASPGCSRSSFHKFFFKGNPFFGLFSQSVGIVIDRAPPDFKKVTYISKWVGEPD